MNVSPPDVVGPTLTPAFHNILMTLSIMFIMIWMIVVVSKYRRIRLISKSLKNRMVSVYSFFSDPQAVYGEVRGWVSHTRLREILRSANHKLRETQLSSFALSLHLRQDLVKVGM